MSELKKPAMTVKADNLAKYINHWLGEEDFIDQYLSELINTLREIDREAIWEATNTLLNAWQRGNQVFIIGNGGSAATASHMANDLNKYTITPGKKRFKAISLTDNIPLMTAWGNDDSYESIFSEQLINFIEPGDVVFAISASGNSPNILKAVQVGRELGAVTIGLAGQTGGKLKSMVDYCVLVPSDQIGRQEDCHLIVNHVIANTLQKLIQAA
jgi:D-sedoheptulose 7-phosphate isomerase